MAIILYEDDNHRCLKFQDLTDSGEVQSNQFLITHERRGVLIDCGGYSIYKDLLGAISRYLPAASLDYFFLSHQDPDVVSGLNLWLPTCQAQILVSSLWVRFLPAICTRGLTEERVTPIPDEGLVFTLAGSPLVAVPAHFLHSAGNFQLYDPVSKILFSGDLGASLGVDKENIDNEKAFTDHVPNMASFHNRYIANGESCRRWVRIVRQLDVEMIVPQHGPRFTGKDTVTRFYAWVEQEKTALDDFADTLYQLPELTG